MKKKKKIVSFETFPSREALEKFINVFQNE